MRYNRYNLKIRDSNAYKKKNNENMQLSNLRSHNIIIIIVITIMLIIYQNNSFIISAPISHLEGMLPNWNSTRICYFFLNFYSDGPQMSYVFITCHQRLFTRGSYWMERVKKKIVYNLFTYIIYYYLVLA